MEHIEQIQEFVDENKEQMPTGKATGIALTHACKAVMGQRLVLLCLGATAQVQSFGIYFNVLRSKQLGQRQRQPQPQQHVPAVVAAGMLSCLVLSCCASSE